MALFNRYKLRRRMGKMRGVRSSDAAVFASNSVYLRDIAWGARAKNPYYKKTLQIQAARNKALFKIFFLIILCFGSVFLTLYHPYFAISTSTININGMDNIKKDDLLSAINSSIDKKVGGIFDARNYFLLNAQDLTNELSAKFPTVDIKIIKNFPHQLNILLSEKSSALIYDNGTVYAYMSTDGKIVSIIRSVGKDEWKGKKEQDTISTSTLDALIHTPVYKELLADYGDNPILFDTRLKTIAINDMVLSRDIVSQFVNWYTNLKRLSGEKINYAVIDNEAGMVRFMIGDGWELRVRLGDDPETQIGRLKLVLQNQVKNLKELHYIDLQYVDRVYWQ